MHQLLYSFVGRYSRMHLKKCFRTYGHCRLNGKIVCDMSLCQLALSHDFEHLMLFSRLLCAGQESALRQFVRKVQI